MKQTTFEFPDNDESNDLLRSLETERKQRLIELMAQAIATVLSHTQGEHDKHA